MKDIRGGIAGICLFVALAGYWNMCRILQAGDEVPADPATRLGYVAGLLTFPTIFLIVAVVLYSRRRSARHGQR